MTERSILGVNNHPLTHHITRICQEDLSQVQCSNSLPSYTVKEIRKLKSQNSRTSECLRFTGPTKKSEKRDQMEPF